MGVMNWLRWFWRLKTSRAVRNNRSPALGGTPPHTSPAVTPVASTGPPFTNWEGYGYLGIVGESHYQDALFRISRSGTTCEATLVPEPANPFDPNAVAVYIEGMVVGYIPRSHARKYHRRLATLPKPLRCPAKVIGGTPDKPHFGVLLDQREVERLPPPKRKSKKHEQIDPQQTPF